VFCLPKAITLIEAGYGDRILLPKPMPSPGFSLVSLQLLGLEIESLPIADVGRTHYQSMHVVEGAAATAGGLEKVRSHMHAACNALAFSNDRSVPVAFITRRVVNNPRVLSNENDTLSICRDFGIQIIDTAGIPFIDQVRMFAGMKAIIGVHGAGLTNMTWMQAGGFAVEITPPPNGSTCYRELADKLGHHYIQICTFTNQSQAGEDSTLITIDPADFRNEIAAVLTRLRIK
jgi:capsular polysaccharide biosynthesis protein